MKKFFSSFITLVMLSLFVVSCGNAPSNVLSGVKVETTQVGQDTWMSFAADINLGAMSFASISVPVLHPRGQTPIGQLELVSGFSGQNQIRISVNLSEVADLNMGPAVLPNGNLIPMIGTNQAIAINVGNGAKVYLALSSTVTAIGIAVPIREFDNIGRSLPGLNFFPVVTTGEVVGTAGIFTGLQSGQSGIAVVADVSKLVNMDKIFGSSALMAIQAQEAEDNLKLDYRSQTLSSSKKSALDQLIYQLNQKRSILRLR